MRTLLLAFALASSPLLDGCDSGPGDAAKNWLGLSSATEKVIELLHKGTGWVLGKNQVKIEKNGEIREVEDGYRADFNITVTNGESTFSTTATGVPCDKNGVPTEESVDKLQEAVEDIKDKVKRLQK
ncbi:MAG: hypothetical protein VCA73_02685 [Roseibacillus sp.]|jgi:hypothetical protein